MRCERSKWIAGLEHFESRPVADDRGSFQKAFGVSATGLLPNSLNFTVRQVNISVTERRGTVRGMHTQIREHQEGKVLFCLTGQIHDVILDLREESPSFLRWTSIDLVSGSGFGVGIPSGCAHGFQVVEGPATVLYLHDGDYVAEMDGGVNCMDPALGLTWPLPVVNRSSRDEALPTLKQFLSDRKLC